MPNPWCDVTGVTEGPSISRDDPICRTWPLGFIRTFTVRYPRLPASEYPQPRFGGESCRLHRIHAWAKTGIEHPRSPNQENQGSRIDTDLASWTTEGLQGTCRIERSPCGTALSSAWWYARPMRRFGFPRRGWGSSQRVVFGSASGSRRGSQDLKMVPPNSTSAALCRLRHGRDADNRFKRLPSGFIDSPLSERKYCKARLTYDERFIPTSRTEKVEAELKG